MNDDWRRSRRRNQRELDPLDEAERLAKELERSGGFDDDEHPTQPEIHVTVNVPQPQTSQPDIQTGEGGIGRAIIATTGLVTALGALFRLLFDGIREWMKTR